MIITQYNSYKLRAKFGTEVGGMGVDLTDAANTYAKKEKARKRFQDKLTRKALVAFVATGTHREAMVKKSSKSKPGKYVVKKVGDFYFFFKKFIYIVLSYISGEKKMEEKPRLDHRKYGAWYLHPQKWEQRFHKMSDPKAISQIKARRIAKEDVDIDTPAEIVTDEEKLHSVRAFRGFLEKLPNYDPPSFLKEALHITK